ncbi:uncharacterized protein C9orf85 homolog [Neocloeon triangulifer]|uniref:uncharacterized protein C9orf85 homolog n=1 Tax=Neocloeon triangulifer TaxID=2078957 RepID=UPI00286F4588|nr:uncharacterized protein C9orf85 homolog [Neocloeon triangulifer]
MSTQRGNGSRTRAQKYKNTSVFKNDKYDKTPKNLQINRLQVVNVCEHCKGVIEWKIKYKKYKPLTAPAKCPKCLEKTVKHSYHTYCIPCAREAKMCPKCGKKTAIEEVEEDQTKLDNEMQQLLKTLPERKRRTFLRYLANKKKEISDEPDKKHEHVKDDLEAKLNELKLAANKEDDEDFSDDDFDSDLDDCDEEESED